MGTESEDMHEGNVKRSSEVTQVSGHRNWEYGRVFTEIRVYGRKEVHFGFVVSCSQKAKSSGCE